MCLGCQDGGIESGAHLLQIPHRYVFMWNNSQRIPAECWQKISYNQNYEKDHIIRMKEKKMEVDATCIPGRELWKRKGFHTLGTLSLAGKSVRREMEPRRERGNWLAAGRTKRDQHRPSRPPPLHSLAWDMCLLVCAVPQPETRASAHRLKERTGLGCMETAHSVVQAATRGMHRRETRLAMKALFGMKVSTGPCYSSLILSMHTVGMALPLQALGAPKCCQVAHTQGLKYELYLVAMLLWWIYWHSHVWGALVLAVVDFVGVCTQRQAWSLDWFHNPCSASSCWTLANLQQWLCEHRTYGTPQLTAFPTEVGLGAVPTTVWAHITSDSRHHRAHSWMDISC